MMKIKLLHLQLSIQQSLQFNYMLPATKEDQDRTLKYLEDEPYLSVQAQRDESTGIKCEMKKKLPKLKWILVIAFAIVLIIIIFTAATGGDSSTQLEKIVKEEKEDYIQELAEDIDIQQSQFQKLIEQVNLGKYHQKKTDVNSVEQIPILPSQPFEAKTVSKGAKGAPSNIENPNVVIDVQYTEKTYLPLPIDYLRKNNEGKTIDQVLYDAEIQKKRQDFHKQRISFLDSKTDFPQVYLTKYNNALDKNHKSEGASVNVKQWQRLNAKFGFDKIKTQIPMCVMVPGFNNNANFRIEYNLNSIFSQNYTDYKVVVINDKSTDGGDQIYRKYFAFHRIDKQRYTYIQNSKRVTALHNIYIGSMNHCPFDSVVVTLDADDEFIGRNVLQVFNWGYQTKKAGVLYTNFIWYLQGSTVMYGFTSEYSEHEKKNNLFRAAPMKFSHLRSYRNELVFQINPIDLQDDNGVFFTITYDIALFIPLMELSCGRVYKLQGQFHYLYNTGTGLNDYNDRGRQVAIENKVRARKKYQCYKDFDNRMN